MPGRCVRLELIGSEKVVGLQHRAVVEAAVRPGRADQYARVRKVNAQRRSPRIEDFALIVKLGLAADEDDQLFRVGALEGLDDFGIAAVWILAHILFVLLQAGKEIFHVGVELGRAGVDAPGIVNLNQIQRAGQDREHTDDSDYSFHKWSHRHGSLKLKQRTFS